MQTTLTEDFGISVQIKANNAGQFVMMEDKSNAKGPMYWPAPNTDDQNYDDTGTSTGSGCIREFAFSHFCTSMFSRVLKKICRSRSREKKISKCKINLARPVKVVCR